MSLPVYFEFGPIGRVIQKQSLKLEIHFFCRFQGTIVCPQLRILLWCKEPKGNTAFVAENFPLANEAVAELPGVFEHAAVYIPNMISIFSPPLAGSLRTRLPPSSLSIFVLPQPPPVDVSIDVPRFLLPNHWQVALVRLAVTRDIPQVDLKVSGLTYKSAPLRARNSVVSDAQSRLCFQDVAAGEYEIYLPIKPRLSGSLHIEAHTGGQSVLREVPFTVSDFLEMRLVCRVASRVAQLSARVTSAVVLEISEVTFSVADNETIGSRSIGLPMTIGQTDTSALFMLDAVPESGHISVQQPGLRPFTLVLRVERLREQTEPELALDPTAPLSTVVPLSFTL
jgi:hypothetical protein